VQVRLVGAVGRAAAQHEAAIAITAIDVAVLVDLQPDARMAARGGALAGAPADRPGTVAGDAGGVDQGRFGRRNAHVAPRDRAARGRLQYRALFTPGARAL